MIKISDGKIGAKEFGAIVILTIGIKFTDTTPNILFDKGKNAAWAIPLVSCIIMGLTFLLLVSLIKKHKVGLVELFEKLTGKYIASILLSAIFIYIFFGTVTNSRSYADIADTMFYPNTPVPVILLILLLISFLIANRGFETIGRSAWLILPAIECASILLVVFVWDDLYWQHLFPIAGPGIKELAITGMTHSSVFGEIMVLGIFYSFVTSFKDYRKASLIGFVLSAFKLIVYLIVYVMVFDIPSVENLAYPFQQLTRFAAIGEVFTHMEAVFLVFWLLGSLIHFSIYLYLSAMLLAKILRLEKFEQLILPVAGLAYYLALLPDNVFQSLKIRELTIISSSLLLITIPLLLWIVDKWKGMRHAKSS